MSMRIGSEGAVTDPAVDTMMQRGVRAKARLVGCEAGNAWEAGVTKTATGQTKQARPTARVRYLATTTQRRAAYRRMQQPYPSPSPRPPARARPVLDNRYPAILACTLIISLSDPVAPLVPGRCGHLESKLRPHNKSSRPPRLIATCRQTIHYLRPCDVPRLLLRVKDIVWPFAH